MPDTPAPTENPHPSASLPPRCLLSNNPLRWLVLFGPGAVIASLTIGAGELIFSARAGALFGFDVLWFFLLVLAAKWVLLYSIARRMVITGSHPFLEWTRLPGPRGWLPAAMLLLAVLCFPVWICFHAGTTGTLLSTLIGTSSLLPNSSHFLWGGILLLVLLLIAFKGGYSALERIQFVILLLLLGAIVLVFLMLRPDWLGLLRSLFLPRSMSYPAWVSAYPELLHRSVWLELITYVGVLGGSSYDYLAYTSYLREKRWGRSHGDHSSPLDKRWLRAPFIDCIASFLAVLIFTIVFVACGRILLAPAEAIPAGSNLLTLQSAFVTPLHPQLQHLYFAGAFLAMAGTLYGTLEVAPVILREAAASLLRKPVNLAGIRSAALLWAGVGGLILMFAFSLYTWSSPSRTAPSMVLILTPANLFTGVLGCGIICLLTVWTEVRLPDSALPMPRPLLLANLLAGAAFFALGLKGYWDHSGLRSLLILAGTVTAGFFAALVLRSKFLNDTR